VQERGHLTPNIRHSFLIATVVVAFNKQYLCKLGLPHAKQHILLHLALHLLTCDVERQVYHIFPHNMPACSIASRDI
jgi:hypothetical protein